MKENGKRSFRSIVHLFDFVFQQNRVIAPTLSLNNDYNRKSFSEFVLYQRVDFDDCFLVNVKVTFVTAYVTRASVAVAFNQTKHWFNKLGSKHGLNLATRT